MFNARKLPKLTVTRPSVAGLGVLVFTAFFHAFVAKPQAATHATEVPALSRLQLALGWPTAKDVNDVASASAQHLLAGRQVPKGPAISATPSAVHPAPSIKQAPPWRAYDDTTVADPALLKALQEALREKRDAEYIYRLRTFRRHLSTVQCQPLPSYALKGLELSNRERDIVACHRHKQLQAQCVIPASIHQPMRCPKDYIWSFAESAQESERQWLAARTPKIR